MAGAVRVLSVVSEAVAAYCSRNFSARREMLETIAGSMLIGGFALLGCALPVML